MDMPDIFELEAHTTDPGVIADAIIDLLDAHWSSYTWAQRDALLDHAERFHAAALKHQWH